jgi:hypothetical protein
MLTAAGRDADDVAVERRPPLRQWILATAGVLFAVVLVLRWVVGGPTDAIALLFSVPIALLAVAFGVRAGLMASGLAVASIVLWTDHSSVHLSALGWAARITPLLLIGVLLGEVADRLRRADAERRRLEAAAWSQREAVEINDTIVQGLTAAKWSLEAGDPNRALDLVTEALDLGHRLVSDLIRQAELAESWTGRRPPPRQE